MRHAYRRNALPWGESLLSEWRGASVHDSQLAEKLANCDEELPGSGAADNPVGGDEGL